MPNSPHDKATQKKSQYIRKMLEFISSVSSPTILWISSLLHFFVKLVSESLVKGSRNIFTRKP